MQLLCSFYYFLSFIFKYNFHYGFSLYFVLIIRYRFYIICFVAVNSFGGASFKIYHIFVVFSLIFLLSFLLFVLFLCIASLQLLLYQVFLYFVCWKFFWFLSSFCHRFFVFHLRIFSFLFIVSQFCRLNYLLEVCCKSSLLSLLTYRLVRLQVSK